MLILDNYTKHRWLKSIFIFLFSLNWSCGVSGSSCTLYQSHQSQWRLDNRRCYCHHHRRQLLWRAAGHLRHHVSLEWGESASHILPSVQLNFGFSHFLSLQCDLISNYRYLYIKCGSSTFTLLYVCIDNETCIITDSILNIVWNFRDIVFKLKSLSP